MNYFQTFHSYFVANPKENRLGKAENGSGRSPKKYMTQAHPGGQHYHVSKCQQRVLPHHYLLHVFSPPIQFLVMCFYNNIELRVLAAILAYGINWIISQVFGILT